MAFNKAKLLAQAQKHLNQGKIPQAIAQFQEILRYDPNDQVALMSLGDLHVRNGEVLKALEPFERLGAIFLKEGFTSKAIAIYKKIAKLVPAEPGPLEHLAELYVRQGVMSEARSIYLQLAELHLKQGRSDAAANVLQNLLELEPDNVRVHERLADLYQSLGRKHEAGVAYLFAARRQFESEQHAEVLRLCARALGLDPDSAEAKVLQARALGELGKFAEAVTALEALPEQIPQWTPLLVQWHTKSGNLARATELARQAFAESAGNATLLLDVAQAALEAGDAEAALALQDEVREALAGSADAERLAKTLSDTAARLPGRLEPLEWLAELCRRSNDAFRLQVALQRLGEALAAAGDTERARAAWEELYDRSRDENARTRANEFREKLGMELLPEPALSGAPTETPPAAATAPEPSLDPETRKLVTQALTDVDLYSSYGMVQKAMELLESLLQRVPQHPVALEKLLDLHVGAGNDRRVVELTMRLEQVCRERGDQGRAEHYAEMRRRYQRVTGIEVEAQPAPEFAVPPTDAAPRPQESQPQSAEQQTVYEVDLSAEWAALSQPAQAEAAPEATADPEPEPAPALPEPVEAPAEAPAESAAVEADEEEVAREAEVETKEEEPEPALEPAGHSGPMSSQQFLNELSSEVGELSAPEADPSAEPPPASPPHVAPPVAAAINPVEEGVSELQEVFNEFRAELGGIGEEEEDLETHYNLGIAYREMGLVEEAIGEFQRVAKGIERGRPFRYAMQCFTLLGLCFLENQQPKIAAMWYRRALETPGLDGETVLALRYDLGAALELAGDTRGALDSFTQVYAMNIDYRDVAERITALEKAVHS